MIVYTITHYDTGHAELVRIISDLRFEVNAFPSQPHCLYFFTWEAIKVSHTQRRLSLGSVRCSPDPMHLHHVWTIEPSASKKCNERWHDHPLWYWPSWTCEDYPRSEIRSECLSISTSLPVLFHLRDNRSIAHAAQAIARVSEMLTRSHATSSCFNKMT